MTPTVVFEPLRSYHDRNAFDCGNSTLNHFLQRQAGQNADRNVGVTHVAVEHHGDSRILAYYTLLTRTVNSETIPTKRIPKGEIGVVLLGRLAVDASAQSRGLGRLCLTRAIFQVAHAAEEIGIYALVLNAIDDRTREWYLGLDFGFKTMLDDPNHLYLPIDTIRQAGISPIAE